MVHEVLLPRLGNTVESCVIYEWSKKIGDSVKKGDILCEVETDKATFEVESDAEGTLLALLAEEGDEVPVLQNIALVGDEGEDVSSWVSGTAESAPVESAEEAVEKTTEVAVQEQAPLVEKKRAAEGQAGVSPRARNLAAEKYIETGNLVGSGPGGRIIERDIKQAIEERGSVSPAAAAAGNLPQSGSGIGGRITTSDIGKTVSSDAVAAPVAEGASEPFTDIAIKGIRKVVAERMHNSLVTTAQLTLNSSAPAEALLGLRKRFKGSPEGMGLQRITINDILLFAVSRVLRNNLSLNAHFLVDKIRQFNDVHLGFAVDSPKGLMVPVVKYADKLSLRQISAETKRLIKDCQESSINPDDLQGGSFTVTNLGAFGIESFTPILNAPEVAILGVGNTQLKPVKIDGSIQYRQFMGLSLTIDHQAVDGAPGARFVKELAESIANIDLLLAD